MGQKLSGLMLTMEEEDACREGEGAKGEANGNSGEADQHFEVIYGCRNEPSTSSSADVANGNVCHDEECASATEPQCACSSKANAKTGAVARKRPEEGVKRTSLRTITFSGAKKSRGKRTKESSSSSNNNCVSVKKRPHWGLRLNCAGLKQDADIPEVATERESGCVCTGYRRTSEPSPPVIDLAKFNPQDFPIEDCDERARLERAREMAEGVEPPPGFNIDLDSLAIFFQTTLGLHAPTGIPLSAFSRLDLGLPSLFQRTHSQADYIHCLVPDLLQITGCSFYWGKMDRYEAERLLEGRPEGTFLLRDSAQEEHLFSVSFRKYGRSLHARIEQWNHKFSFDSHDPGVYASPTVCGLIEHYKDSSFCMFFEPMLTIPLHRNFPFPLQHLCRAAICNRTDYDSISRLPLPKVLKMYLREYHYKQRVRVRNIEPDHVWLSTSPPSLSILF